MTARTPYTVGLFEIQRGLFIEREPVPGTGANQAMKRKFFGTDGIRGRANSAPMTAEIALKVGMAAGLVFRRGEYRHRVVIGKDTRLSGYMFESALVAGLTTVGVDVFQLGPMPTPAVAMLTRSLRADLGIMISASHNPYHDNGIKLFGPDGYKLSDEVEAEIEALIESDMTRDYAEPAMLGRATRVDGVHDRYIEFAKRTFPRHLRLDGLRVAVDCANGAAYKVAPAALWELGAEVVAIGDEPNGFNINEECGSTAPEALCRKVHEVRADIGIALDGDADRVLIVDEQGRLIDGDQLMAVIAESWAANGRLAAGGVVATVMSNLGLERYLNAIDLTLERTPVGDRYEPLPQVLRNVRLNGGKPLDDAEVKKVIADGKSRLGEQGRLVIRLSGTEPLIRVMGEGDDQILVEDVVGDIISAIEHAA